MASKALRLHAWTTETGVEIGEIAEALAVYSPPPRLYPSSRCARTANKNTVSIVGTKRYSAT